MDDREPLAFPLDVRSIALADPVDLGTLRVGWTEDFGQCPVDPEIRAIFRRRIVAVRHLFRNCEEVKFDFGEANSCFDIVRAQNFVERYRAIYQKDPNSLGPNVRANYEIGARMSLADMAWAHAEQTQIFDASRPPSATMIWYCRRQRRSRHFRGHSFIWTSSTARSCATTITGLH